MSRRKGFVVALVLCAGVLGGCQTTSGPPPCTRAVPVPMGAVDYKITGVWPDVACGSAGVTARALLDDIVRDAWNAYAWCDLSYPDLDQVLHEVDVCKTSPSAGGDDAGHCAHVMLAKQLGRFGMWIKAAKELELGH